MRPCQDPELLPDPDDTDPDHVGVERINVAKAYRDCKGEKAALVTFIKTLIGQPTGSAIGKLLGKK